MYVCTYVHVHTYIFPLLTERYVCLKNYNKHYQKGKKKNKNENKNKSETNQKLLKMSGRDDGT